MAERQKAGFVTLPDFPFDLFVFLKPGVVLLSAFLDELKSDLFV